MGVLNTEVNVLTLSIAAYVLLDTMHEWVTKNDARRTIISDITNRYLPRSLLVKPDSTIVAENE